MSPMAVVEIGLAGQLRPECRLTRLSVTETNFLGMHALPSICTSAYMFNRTSRRVADCVKCQRRIKSLKHSWEPFSLSSTSPPGRRWQSTVAIEVDEDDPVSHSANNNLQTDSNGDSPDRAHKLDDNRRDRQHQEARDTRYRRWQPHKAEQLGVSVLGRPAEVLILPTRKRKIANPVPEDVEATEKGGIQESLDSELKPVSMEDVLNNIDSLKHEMGQGRDRFSTLEWKEHRKRLSDGFTKAQLQEYLRVAAGKSKSDPKEEYMPANDQKRSMAAKIMNDVWKWSSRDEDDAVSASQPKPVTKTIVINAAKLDYIMLHEKQQLASISESFDVRIDVFKKKSRMQLAGTRLAVDKAHVELSKVVKNIQAISLQIPKGLQVLLKDNAKSDGLLTMLMEKHKLIIQRNRDSLNVVGPTQAHVDVILRDMVLFLSKVRASIPSSFFPAEDEKLAVQALYFSDGLPQWLQQDKKWSRHISTRPQSDVGDEASISNTRELRKMTSKLLKSEKPDQNKLSRYVTVPGSLAHEYTASIGQTLFNVTTTSDYSIGNPSLKDAETKSIFVSQQALLPQVLSRKDFIPLAEPVGRQTGPKEEDSQPLLLHLRLRPVTETSFYPRFEIVLSGQDASLGLRQHMQIKQVHAILDEWQHSILLPHQPADILLSRQSRIDLIGNNKVRPSAAYLNILRQIGSYLEEAQPTSQLELPPVWKIDLSPLVKNKAIQQKHEDSTPPSTTPEEQDSTTGEQANPKSVPATKSTTSYVLEPPEYMDVSSYSSAATGDRCIEHVVCDTDALERPRSRHVLRIVRNSLSTADSKSNAIPTSSNNTVQQQKWFKESITAAYNLIAVFGDASKTAGQTTDPTSSLARL